MTPARLQAPDGTSGDVVPVGSWSAEVRSVTGPDRAAWTALAVEWAAARQLLDLRCREPLPGSSPLPPRHEGDQPEHALPVPRLLPDAAATRGLGALVAGAVRAGDLLVLSGPLGAGKTTFTQGLGEALGVRGRVTSPTFVLARVHRGPLPLVHVDAYRLRDAAEQGRRLDLDDLDLDAALEAAVTVVEWGEGLVEALSDDRLEVRLHRSGDDDRRTALVVPRGSRWRVLD